MMAYSRSLACIGALLVVAAALAAAPCEAAAAAGTSTGHHLLGVQGYKKGHGYGYKKSSYGGGHYNKGYYKKGYGRKLSGSSEAESVMPEALPAQLSDPLVATDAGVEGRALLSTQATQGYKKGHGYGYKKSSYGGGHYNKGYYKKGYGRKLSGSSEAESVMPEALPAQLSDPLVATDAGVEGRALLSTQATQGYKKGHGYGYKKSSYGGGHYNKGYYKKGYGRKLSGSSEAESVMPEALPAQLSDPLVATDAGVEGRALLSTQATQGYKKGHGYGYKKSSYGGGHYNKGYYKKGYGRKLSGSTEADALVQS